MLCIGVSTAQELLKPGEYISGFEDGETAATLCARTAANCLIPMCRRAMTRRWPMMVMSRRRNRAATPHIMTMNPNAAAFLTRPCAGLGRHDRACSRDQ